MSTLSVLILCGRSPRHLYVANRLCAAGKAVAIVQEADAHWTLKKVARLLARPKLLFRKVWRWIRDRRRYRGNQEAGFFFGERPPVLDRPELAVEVPHIDDPGLVELAKEHQPDVIAVFGTSLIRGPLLREGRLGIVNLHGGLSPEYRGADCTFWALYNEEPQKVGCTLHFINEGIDTGDLIAHICPDIKADDEELTLFWKGIKLSADCYAELLERLEAGERFGQTQDSKGRLYQVKDRLLRHERKVDASLKNGLLEKSELPPRVTWFAQPSE